MKKISLLIISIMLAAALFSGCNEAVLSSVKARLGTSEQSNNNSGDSESKELSASDFFGEWVEQGGKGTVSFKSDMRGTSANLPYPEKFSFTLESRILTMTGSVGIPFRAGVRLDDGGMYLSSGDDLRFFLRVQKNENGTSVSDRESAESIPNSKDVTIVPEESTSERSIVGTWRTKYNDETLIYCFKADGTGYASISGMLVPITYTAKDGMLNVTGFALGASSSGGIGYNFDGDNLVCIKDGKTHVFTPVS